MVSIMLVIMLEIIGFMPFAALYLNGVSVVNLVTAVILHLLLLTPVLTFFAFRDAWPRWAL